MTEIDDKAKICPNCKKDLRDFAGRYPIITFVLLLIILWSIFNWIINIINPNSQDVVNTSNTPYWIEFQFSWFDGSHIYLKEYLKKNLKDPGSLEIIDTRYVDTRDLKWNDYLIVNMKYRAKNSFWWYVVETIKAQFDKNWNPINIDKWETY